MTGRFAPSPSGRMHLGNVFSALMAWLSVRSQNGTMVLRIEDLDPDRCRPEYAETLKDDLRWLGLDWDREQTPQSQRTEAYAEQFQKISHLVYPATAPAESFTPLPRPTPPTGGYSMPERAGS